jgi:predicted porin
MPNLHNRLEEAILKKTLIAIAAVAASALTTSALAQSSVTLFGVVDVGVRQLDNADVRQSQLSTDGLSSSRLGFRGIEDLGGGLKAGFWLESQVNPDTGTSNSSRFWHRRSTISLLSNSLGELRLGRDKVPGQTLVDDFDVFGTTGIGDPGNMYSVLGGIDTKSRADNLVAYFLPSLGGLYGNVSVAAGEGTPGKKYFGGRIGYRSGAFDLSAVYSETEVTTDNVELFVLGGSYDFGVVKVSGTYQEASYQNDDDTRYSIGASMPFGPVLVRASYTNTDGSGPGIGNRDADGFALGGIYSLSKRTALYATYATIDNEGTANFTVGSISGRSMPKTEERSQGFELGVRHSF